MSPTDIPIPGLPHGSYKTFATASARYYHAPFGSKPPQWEYSNYRGILVFGRNLGINSYPLAAGAAPDPDDAYWFRLLVSRSGETKTVWLFKVSTDLNYQIDKPYFHVIQGLTRQYGFVFDYDDAAANFAEQVRANYIPPPSPDKLFARSLSRRGTKKANKTHSAKLVSNKSHTSPIVIAPVVDSFRRIVGLGKFGTYGGRGSKIPEPVWQVIPGPQRLELGDSETSYEFLYPENVPTVQ